MWLHTEVNSLADIPRYWARVAPERTALIDPLGTRTFRELDEVSNRIGAAIRASGIAQNGHVGFLGKNSSRYFELLFGASKAGCAIVPLNWRLAAAELLPVVEDAQASLVFVDREFAESFRAVAAQCAHRVDLVIFDSTSSAPGEFEAWLSRGDGKDPAARIHPDDTAVLIYTSGTTGRPKGVQLSHGGFHNMRLCEHLEPAYEWRDGDVMLTVMPVFHLVGTGLSIQSLYNGATVSLLPALEPVKLMELIARDRPTICALVPTAIQMVLDHPAAKTADFSSLRLVMYAGSPISATLLKRALVEMKCQFMQFYGATESSGAMTLLRPAQHDLETESKLRSCGTPLPLIEIRIVDADGRDVPEGQTGEFWVRGPNIFRGYWNQPDATAAVLKDGWYRTGDAGYRDRDGLLYIVDRVKDMIVTGGENVYSAEVEQALAKHPAVKQCAVIGVPDPKWGEKVTAVVIPATGASPTPEELIAHCRGLIAGYKVPKSVHFVEAMPMTATGKVLKRAVRDQFWKGAGRAIG
ncbi:MAG TPA: long-chain-fatty-acid--CoA ligase [Nevskiaceae bacterium]|nr:long-chain-fatty-acid--CoA ligase [Nevskiaceae bacterium]